MDVYVCLDPLLDPKQQHLHDSLYHALVGLVVFDFVGLVYIHVVGDLWVVFDNHLLACSEHGLHLGLRLGVFMMN